MSNNSASGGYLTPTNQGLPGGLTLEQFIQQVIVGISGYQAALCRPQWQSAPPKSPDLSTNWIAYSIQQNAPDANAYTWLNNDGVTSNMSRQETLSIQLGFYGPNAQEGVSGFRDGFQITQNLEALQIAKMGFTGCGPALHGPDLVNERWIDRYEMTLVLVRWVQRTYPILSFASAVGTLHTVVNGNDTNIPFQVEEIV